ncbi:MAG: DUF2244 domain-containing protein [Akkermansiaceae bacterium]|nr:DUF2244 domain-containing protein [Akkermansiaceae bacterium]
MTFLEKLAAKAQKAAMDKAFAKGLLRCPKCGQKPATAPADVDTLLRCGSCGFDALPAEWQPDPTGVVVADPDEIPAGTRISREGSAPGDCVWHIPASGKFGFFLFFGLFWTAITAAASGAFLFGGNKGGSETQPWFLYPFFAIFWAIGLGMLYAALRNKYARHRITVTRDLVTLRREMFGRVKEKSLVTTQVGSVAQVEFYQQNYQPVYGVEIRGQGGKLRFGTTLREEEKAWLVADIKRAVFGEAPASPGAAASPAMLAARRQSSFSFPLPPGPKGHWIMGVFFVLIGLGAIAMGVFHGPDIPKHGKDGVDWFAVVFDALFSLFSLIPIIVGLVFGGIGVLFIRSTWPGRQREVRLEGDETQVALRTYQHGRVLKEQSFPRSSVSGVRATGTGHVNGKPMKRIDLIVDGKARRITMWTEGDAADVWADDVNRALGS